KGGQFQERLCQQFSASPAIDILSIVCIFFYLGRSWGQKQTYIVSASQVVYVGAPENVIIQAQGYTESFAATIAIKSYPDKNFTYSFGQVNLSPENKFQSSANLTIQPKDLSGGQNAVSHVYLEVVSAHFSKAAKIPLCYDNGFLFIQTGKSVYNSDQSVKVRIYSLDEDLKPSQREVTLTFIDPEGSEVAVVGKKNYTGVISFPDFKIPSDAKYGLWTIKAKYKEDFTTTGTAYFEIKSHDPYRRCLLRIFFLDLSKKHKHGFMWNLSLAKNGGIIISASNFKHPRMRKCCYYGAYQKEERAARITIGPICSRAFSQCCNLANHLWNETFHISVIVGSSYGHYLSSKS
uniref:Complement C5 n=1 Tax=Equus caballus TaxID=9796 RepID=A0A3Q2GYZ5_HORSE